MMLGRNLRSPGFQSHSAAQFTQMIRQKLKKKGKPIKNQFSEVHVVLEFLTRSPARMVLHLSPGLALTFCFWDLTCILCQKPSSVLLTGEPAMVSKDPWYQEEGMCTLIPFICALVVWKKDWLQQTNSMAHSLWGQCVLNKLLQIFKFLGMKVQIHKIISLPESHRNSWETRAMVLCESWPMCLNSNPAAKD